LFFFFKYPWRRGERRAPQGAPIDCGQGFLVNPMNGGVQRNAHCVQGFLVNTPIKRGVRRNARWTPDQRGVRRNAL